VPAKKKPERQFKVGDRVLVNLHRGRIEEATITAIIERTSGKKLQVDSGKDMTELIDTAGRE
jgi:hypothetical protein